MVQGSRTLTTAVDLEVTRTRVANAADGNVRMVAAERWASSWVAPEAAVEWGDVVASAVAAAGEEEAAAVGVGRYSKSPTPAKGAPDKIQKTMHEFKHGQLKSGSKHGPKVRSRKQAIAIALSQQRKANKGRRTKRASRRR